MLFRSGTIAPHGGTLVDLLAPAATAERLAAEARNLPKLVVNERELADLEMLATGALSPLRGFAGKADYDSVIDTMHLADGTAWTIPVTLSLADAEAKRIGGADRVALLAEEGGEPLAVVDVEGTFTRDREREAASVFGTTDTAHPGVEALHAAGRSEEHTSELQSH